MAVKVKKIFVLYISSTEWDLLWLSSKSIGLLVYIYIYIYIYDYTDDHLVHGNNNNNNNV